MNQEQKPQNISLRDYLAAQALQALIAKSGMSCDTSDNALKIYRLVDRMLSGRGQT